MERKPSLLAVIPAKAGTHGGERPNVAHHATGAQSMGPGVRRDDEGGKGGPRATVIPAQAGIQTRRSSTAPPRQRLWIPASAGMTMGQMTGLPLPYVLGRKARPLGRHPGESRDPRRRAVERRASRRWRSVHGSRLSPG
ncbi:hypothetical protein D9601_08690 [Sphingomonas sp. MA1305]|nr:hypothetical protein [Sphingomonas sp. MA1305]